MGHFVHALRSGYTLRAAESPAMQSVATPHNSYKIHFIDYPLVMIYWNSILMDGVHLLKARHFRGGNYFSSKFGAHEVCIAPQNSTVHSAIV